MNPDTKNNFWLKVHITMDPILENPTADYLVGVMNASVEQSVEVPVPPLCITVYLQEKNPDIQQQAVLRNQVENHIKELALIFLVEEPKFSWERIEDQDWSNNWKVHFKPFAITKGLIIVPTWEEYTAKKDEQILTMDPGMAFGTGHHATTSLSLNFLRQILATENKQRVLDVGTGTGILGMGAALFGAQQVLGIDNDPDAVTAATENVARNHLHSVMQVSLKPLKQIDEHFNIIAANIIHDVLVGMALDFKSLLAHNGHLVLSGILHGEQEKNIIRVYTDCKFVLVKTEQQEEWVALHFVKK